MDLDKLKAACENEPKYRFKQAEEAVFSDLIDSWEKATNLPKDLRKELSLKCPVLESELVKMQKSKGTTKALIALKDGAAIETVLMEHKDERKTVCVSSQAGCKLNCAFCATGQKGFNRNLLPIEIVEQALFFARMLKKKPTNIVFMGMGEPFLNYENVMLAIRIMNSKMDIGARKISVSTAGIIDGIQKLAKENLQINLAVSLHAPFNELRSKLMPINKAYPIEKLILAAKAYAKMTKRKVMFEYLMIKNFNDSPQCAKRLAEILRHPLFMVNIISFNRIPGSSLKPSDNATIKSFKQILAMKGVNATERYRFGGSIDAACGQLAGKIK